MTKTDSYRFDDLPLSSWGAPVAGSIAQPLGKGAERRSGGLTAGELLALRTRKDDKKSLD